MQVTGSVKTVRRTINLDDKFCTTEFGKMACEKLTFCLKYGGKMKQENNNVDMKMRVQLDAKNPLSPRAFFSRKDLVGRRIGADFNYNLKDFNFKTPTFINHRKEVLLNSFVSGP